MDNRASLLSNTLLFACDFSGYNQAARLDRDGGLITIQRSGSYLAAGNNLYPYTGAAC